MPAAVARAKSAKTKLMNGKVVSSRNRSGDPACSQAMSEWVTTRKSGSTPASVFAILGQCRAKARALKQASQHKAAGNEAKAQRLEAIASGKKGPVTAKDRMALAKEKRATLNAKRAANPITAAMQGGGASAGGAPAPVKAAGRGTAERMELARSIKAVRDLVPREMRSQYGVGRGATNIHPTNALRSMHQSESMTVAGEKHLLMGLKTPTGKTRAKYASRTASAEASVAAGQSRLKKIENVLSRRGVTFSPAHPSVFDPPRTKRQLEDARTAKAEMRANAAYRRLNDSKPGERHFGPPLPGQKQMTRLEVAQQLRADRAAKRAPAQPAVSPRAARYNRLEAEVFQGKKDGVPYVGLNQGRGERFGDPQVANQVEARRNAVARAKKMIRSDRAQNAAPAPTNAIQPAQAKAAGRGTAERMVEAAKLRNMRSRVQPGERLTRGKDGKLAYVRKTMLPADVKPYDGSNWNASPAAPASPRPLGAFGQSMTPLSRGKAKASLDATVRHNGEFMSRKAMIDKAVKSGAAVQQSKTGRRLTSPSGAFLDEGATTKTGMNYAEMAASRFAKAQQLRADRAAKRAPAQLAEPRFAAMAYNNNTDVIRDNDHNFYATVRTVKGKLGTSYEVKGYSKFEGKHPDIEKNVKTTGQGRVTLGRYSTKEEAHAAAMKIAEREAPRPAQPATPPTPSLRAQADAFREKNRRFGSPEMEAQYRKQLADQMRKTRPRGAQGISEEGKRNYQAAENSDLELTVRQTQSMPKSFGTRSLARKYGEFAKSILAQRAEAVATKLAATRAIPRGTPDRIRIASDAKEARRLGVAKAADALTIGRATEGIRSGALPKDTLTDYLKSQQKVLKNQESAIFRARDDSDRKYAENAAAKARRKVELANITKTLLSRKPTKPARTAARS